MQKVIKGSLWSGIVIFLITVGIAAVLVYKAQPTVYYHIVEVALIIVGILALTSALVTAIVLDDQGVTYKMIGSSKRVAWADLVKAELDMGTNVVTSTDAQGTHNSVRSYSNISLWDNRNFISSPLVINMKSFPQRAIPELATFMASKVDSSKLTNLTSYINNQLT